MTIGQLKDRIREWQEHADLDDNTPVIVSHDAEGNDFTPLDSVSKGDYAEHVVTLINDRRGKNANRPTVALILWPE